MERAFDRRKSSSCPNGQGLLLCLSLTQRTDLGDLKEHRARVSVLGELLDDGLIRHRLEEDTRTGNGEGFRAFFVGRGGGWPFSVRFALDWFSARPSWR